MTDSSNVSGSGDTKVQHPVQETLAHPVQRVTTAVERVPGVDRVKGIVDGVLDSVGIVSPHARRVAAYTGAGLLGVAGVVEWPVVMAGAAVVWLTQPRPKDAAAAPAARSAKAQTTARPHEDPPGQSIDHLENGKETSGQVLDRQREGEDPPGQGVDCLRDGEGPRVQARSHERHGHLARQGRWAQEGLRSPPIRC